MKIIVQALNKSCPNTYFYILFPDRKDEQLLDVLLQSRCDNSPLYSAAEFAIVCATLPLPAGIVSYWLVWLAPSQSEWKRPTNFLTFFYIFNNFL
jgi:hypothetical protein